MATSHGARSSTATIKGPLLSGAGGCVVPVEAPSVTPGTEAGVKAHQSDLLLLVSEAKGERWQFYFNAAFDGKNKAWAEGYATAQVRREQEEAERKGSEEMDPAFMVEFDALQPKT
jgi:hypothetical protein